MDTEQLMRQYPILSKAWDECSMVWKGIAVPCEKSTSEGGTIASEKVVKFSRKALRRVRHKKADPRVVGNVDTMKFPIGKPGSQERIAALIKQYDALSENETSPFEGE